MPSLTEQIQEIRQDVTYIKKVLTGDLTDETKPGLVVRLDRLEQRQQLRDKFLWALISAISANAAVSIWTSIN